MPCQKTRLSKNVSRRSPTVKASVLLMVKSLHCRSYTAFLMLIDYFVYLWRQGVATLRPSIVVTVHSPLAFSWERGHLVRHFSGRDARAPRGEVNAYPLSELYLSQVPLPFNTYAAAIPCSMPSGNVQCSRSRTTTKTASGWLTASNVFRNCFRDAQ